MNIKELNNIIEGVLNQETKKLIIEQISKTNKMIDTIKNFQTLYGMSDKISNVEEIDDGFIVNIKDIKPEELVDCCGGTSLSDAQKNLIQGLHHDLEENGMGNNFDIDIETQGDENTLTLIIKIITNNDELLGNTDMKEITKDTNPAIDKKKDIILGNKELSVDEAGINPTAEVVEDEKWIQKAINPKHKGYCTPMTKKTCTPRRKALAKRFKKGIEKESVKKKTITLNEKQMKELLIKIINEATETMDATTDRVRRENDRQNKEALAAVDKKIKDYLSFKGNDNPEFPNQIGQGEEKAARQNSKEQDKEVDINRGRGPQDLDYDTDGIDDNGEPNKKFRDRMEKALVGDSTMGNSQNAVGIVKTKTGENILKSMKNRREALRKEPIYPKEAVPVEIKPEPKLGRPVNENIISKEVTEDINKMKRIFSYNEKTQ
jgi:hypothetical protein